MSSPRVSVLLPVRDGRPWIREALDSIRTQTLADLEILVVDDGSRDGTRDVVDAAALDDSRIRVLDSDGRGIVAALETARRAARAPFLARMDADDRAPPDRLERQAALLTSHPDMALCGAPVRYFPRTGLGEGSLRYESWLASLDSPEAIERDLFVECPLAHPTFFARAAALAAVGGYRDGPFPEDYDLLLRLWEAGARLGRVDGAPQGWRVHDQRLSARDPRYALDAFRSLKVEVLCRTLLRRDRANARAVAVWGAGPTGKAFERLLRARGASIRAFLDLDPRKVGQEIRGAPVLHADDVGAVDDCFVLGAVANAEARDWIRARLRDAGRSELESFVMVA